MWIHANQSWTGQTIHPSAIAMLNQKILKRYDCNFHPDPTTQNHHPKIHLRGCSSNLQAGRNRQIGLIHFRFLDSIGWFKGNYRNILYSMGEIDGFL